MRLIAILFLLLFANSAFAQDLSEAANNFLNTLSAEQKLSASFPFDSEDRYAFHFFPKNDRKGIALRQMSEVQRTAAWKLVSACLNDKAIEQAKTIMSLESILKLTEKRGDDDDTRDAGKYFFSVYGIPGKETVWGWRLEGHHLSYNFAAEKNRLVSGTPAFTGSNPGIVQEGSQRGLETLREQADAGYRLLSTLDPAQAKKAVFDQTAPGEIVTFVSKQASISPQTGIKFSELNTQQQQLLLALVNVYVDRYTKLFADQMKKEIQQAGLNNLSFSWAGSTKREVGNPHYFRVQGPTIIIEYDNTQNGGNHVHSVLRDLKTDFGGDLLLEHYRKEHK
ncbi:MAG TPA: DUF3500 domain-containing protein [Flavitalea sp.]|nr:DUF3500 domain-containing protein [Flavitalea sp.]